MRKLFVAVVLLASVVALSWNVRPAQSEPYPTWVRKSSNVIAPARTTDELGTAAARVKEGFFGTVNGSAFVGTYTHSHAGIMFSTIWMPGVFSPVASDDNMLIKVTPFAGTIRSLVCHATSGTVLYTVRNGGSMVGTIQAAGGNFVFKTTGLANATFAYHGTIKVNTTTVAGSPAQGYIGVEVTK